MFDWTTPSPRVLPSSSVGRAWLEVPPVAGSGRQAYYQSMEQLYRRLSLQAGRRARREALRS